MKHNFLWASGLITVIALFSFSLRPAEAQTSPSLVEEDPMHPVEVFQSDSSALTLIDAFSQAGVAYYPEDIATVFPDPSLGLGSLITVQRAMPITLTDGKKTYSIRTWQSTVQDVLAEKNIILGDDDRIAPSLTTSLQLNMSIAITRVARTTVTETERIVFKTIENDDPTLYRGTNIVTQEGRDGFREKKYLVIREDGELVSKTLTSNVVTRDVVNKVVRVGTKLKIGVTSFGKATWYCNDRSVENQGFSNSYKYVNCFNPRSDVASDTFKPGTEVKITNLDNGKSIIVFVDGCIVQCPFGNVGTTTAEIDLAPNLHQQLGGTWWGGVMRVKVEEIL